MTPAPEQGEAQERCHGSGRISFSTVDDEGKPVQGQYDCPGCPDCKQGEAASEERDAYLRDASEGFRQVLNILGSASLGDREKVERAFRKAEMWRERIALELAPPEAASVCPTCEAQRPDYCAHHGRNLSRHRHKGEGCCTDPFHDTPLPADQERCECGEPDTRHVVHRSDGPCYQYEDAAESASPEESAEERWTLWRGSKDDVWKRANPEFIDHARQAASIETIEVVPASLLTALQAERDEAVANLNHPYLCSCGQGPHGKGTGIMGSDTPEPGPDCRPLTWQEVAERASEAAGARRKEGHKFFLEKRRAEAHSSSLEAALRQILRRVPRESVIHDIARDALANSPTEADE